MAAEPENLKITFFPPLHHQRRIWVLDILRRERVTEIIDIGCGDGALLASLCQPAPWLGPRALARLRRPREADDHELSSLLESTGLNDEDTPDLHPTRIAGLDISMRAINLAAECTVPDSDSGNEMYTRWEALDVDLWLGGLDAINPAFVGAECIIATEVIEHLMDDVLAHFAPVILGVYQPRLFLMTTPSYTFNARFAPPGTRQTGGYTDPTGRTDRVYRHPDHKFEWTTEEFAQWCTSVARKWGYVVEVGSVGTAQEKDPWDRDRDHYVAHPRAGNPANWAEISNAIVDKFEQWGEARLRIEELWFSQDISILCGGSIEAMFGAVERDKRLVLQRIAGQRRGNWMVELVGGVQLRRANWSTKAQVIEVKEIVMEDEEDTADPQNCSFDSGIHMNWNSVPWHSEDSGWPQDQEFTDSWGTGNTCDWNRSVGATWG